MAWQRKPTGATWLFMINRYLMLVTGVLGGPFPGLEVRLPWMSSHHQHGAVVDTSNSCAGVFVVAALMFSQFIVFATALGTRLALIVADLLVVVLTWVKTWETRRLASEAGIQVPLITLLLRDGTVYFM
ncbi:hypothetical protein PHLCEN_2v11073 [Hermanssonia centrifuga]|uniref:Uncharacterized protein n=1 Tax=Hermanssonia centrifuga TaxID=98765 RepID=A0A2R6NL68_9APHY|nr:hypothetical protein PHLCEN_2v11073 [Hermanssonia centrifuga]